MHPPRPTTRERRASQAAEELASQRRPSCTHGRYLDVCTDPGLCTHWFKTALTRNTAKCRIIRQLRVQVAVARILVPNTTLGETLIRLQIPNHLQTVKVS